MGGYPPSVYYKQDIKYQWKTRGENCPYCDIMEGRVYTLDVLLSTGVYPGFHQGCNCYISEVPPETEMSDLDIFGSALNMRNEGWFEAIYGHWDRLWLPGWYKNPHALLAAAKPGMTAAQALKIVNDNYNFGMFDYMGFPGNIFYTWNTHLNVRNSSYESIPTLKQDIYTGFRQLISGEYLVTILSGKKGMFLVPPEIKPLSPAQTYHNKTYTLGGGH